ncbi:MAG: sugar phosphate nucleotidyltransferase [Candidatus Bathyarchaeia archaeon]
MKAVVLAAGEGQRLRPLTLTRPKHMIPVGGKPILEHLLNILKEVGIKEVLIIVNYKADAIKGYFGDGIKFGVKIDYILQREVRGTADAIATTEEHIKEDFLAVNGDLFLSVNAIKSVIETHKKEEPAVTLAAVKVENPAYYGALKTVGNNLVDILEKPSRELSMDIRVNAGIYMFSKEIFNFIKCTEPSERGEIEITDSIRLLIKDGGRAVVANIPDEEWIDIGMPWDLLDANIRVLESIKPNTLGLIEEGTHIKGPVFIGEGTLIRSGSYIEGPVFIGDGSDVGPNCYIRPYTSIGRNVRIGNACEVKNSIIMDNVHIGHLSYVGDSIIGEECNLGAGSILANLRLDGKNIRMRVKDKEVDTGREKMGAIIGDNVKTGVGALLMPGVKIGCNSWIGPNIVVYDDIEPNTILILEQQIKHRAL